MDIRIIFNEKDGCLNGHLHHAKNVTLLCDCGVSKIIVENVDGSFERYDLDVIDGMIRIEDMNKGSGN